VDKLDTSDDYLLARVQSANLFKVHYEPHQTLRERIGGAAAHAVESTVVALLSRFQRMDLR
jgi:hypothetical protein